MRTAVAEVPDEDYERPSGCTGWLVRDLVCHLVIGAQDVLITLVTPAESEPTVDAVTYWGIVEPPTGEDPLDALIPRLAAAYGEPRWLKFHLDDVGSAAGRAAQLADPAARVSTRDEVLTVGDFLSAYVLEWTLHHLDLIAHLPSAAQPPPRPSRRFARRWRRSPGPRSPPRSPTRTRSWSAPDVAHRPTRRRPRWATSPRGSRSSSAERALSTGRARAT